MHVSLSSPALYNYLQCPKWLRAIVLWSALSDAILFLHFCPTERGSDWLAEERGCHVWYGGQEEAVWRWAVDFKVNIFVKMLTALWQVESVNHVIFVHSLTVKMKTSLTSGFIFQLYVKWQKWRINFIVLLKDYLLFLYIMT